MTFDFDRKEIRYILTDRKSKYTASGGKVTTKQEVKQWMKELTKDKQFAKATHNSYARRITNPDGSVDE
jgi:putative IMPACT (imprinted ancient) family translation regulator